MSAEWPPENEYNHMRDVTRGGSVGLVVGLGGYWIYSKHENQANYDLLQPKVELLQHDLNSAEAHVNVDSQHAGFNSHQVSNIGERLIDSAFLPALSKEVAADKKELNTTVEARDHNLNTKPGVETLIIVAPLLAGLGIMRFKRWLNYRRRQNPRSLEYRRPANIAKS